jgi:hypothetical protein
VDAAADQAREQGVVLFTWKGAETSIQAIWEELVEFSFTGIMTVRSLHGGKDSEGKIYIHLGYPLGASYEFMQKGKRRIEGTRAMVYILEDAKHKDSVISLMGQVDVIEHLAFNVALMMTENLQIGRFNWKKMDLTIEGAKQREEQMKKDSVRFKLPKVAPVPEKEAVFTWEMVKMMRLVASEWFSSGYRVNRLMRLLNDQRPDLEVMRSEFIRCEERIRELKRYEAGLRSLDVEDVEERKKIAAVISELKDPDTVERSAQNAEMLISEIQAKRASERDREEAMFRLTLASEWRERIRASKLEELYGTIIARLSKKEPRQRSTEFYSVPETSDAHEACTSKIEDSEVIVIIGPPGSGKTRLLSESMDHAVSRGAKVLSWVMGTPPMEGEADLYLIDGLERITGDAETKLCSILDSVVSRGKGRVIIASSLRIENLKLSNDATLVKLSPARAFELPQLSFDSRVELLKKRAEQYGFKIRTGVLAYVARVRRGSTRSLLLSMDKLIAMSLLLRREIDIDFARETIPEL